MFGMFSTDFWFMEKDETDAQQRRENAQVLCAVVKQIKEKYNIPVLAAGDLNSAEATGQTLAGYEDNYGTLDNVFAYNENVFEMESFDVLTHREAMLSSDHCPVIVEFTLK